MVLEDINLILKKMEIDICSLTIVQIHFVLPIQFPKMQPAFTLQSSQVRFWKCYIQPINIISYRT